MEEKHKAQSQNQHQDQHQSQGEETVQGKVRFYTSLMPVLTYFFRKKDEQRPSNFNIRMMHGINKISIVMFLIGATFFIIKLLTRS